MVSEVNKIIRNALVEHGAVLLPEIGVLYVERTPSRSIGRREVVAPKLTLSLSTTIDAISLVEVIATTASIDIAQAEDIYARWFNKVSHEGEIQIEGVAVIRHKSVSVDTSLLDTLNLPFTPSVTIRYRRRGGVVTAIIMPIVILLCAAAIYLYTKPKPAHEVVIAEVVTSNDIKEIIAPAEEPMDAVEPMEDIVVEVVVEPEVEIVWYKRDGICHRVVVGSYSTEENATRAIAQIEKQLPGVYCDIFMLGSMYAVAAYGSAEKSECEAFAKQYRKDFPQSWIYTPKRFR